jgi:Omp85 superfamily domain
MKILLSAFFIFLLSAATFAEEESSSELPSPEAAQKGLTYQADPVDRSHGHVVIPYALYNSETSLALGIVLLNYFQLGDEVDNVHPSVFRTNGEYTLKNQVRASFGPDLYLSNGQYKTGGNVSYVYFPDSFYGLGTEPTLAKPESYTIQYYSLNAYLKRVLLGGWQIGPTIDFENLSIKAADDSSLRTQSITGSKGGLISGWGLALTWDRRDSSFYPREGSLIEGSATFYGPLLGSDFAWEKYAIDVRNYFPLWLDHVLAIQGYLQYNHGDPPFTRLARLGGDKLMRGYVRGRYRDLSLGALQAEYRALLFWKIGGTLFANLGNVGPTPLDLFRSVSKPSAGFGLRYLVDPKQNINARIDVGFGRDSFGLHMNIEEAF